MQDFIDHFKRTSLTGNITEVFGCCYWFAYILCGRFPEAQIMYDPVMNHFMAWYNGKLFDVTGDVTEQYKAIPWEDFDDDLERERIVEQCIKFKQKGSAENERT